MYKVIHLMYMCMKVFYPLKYEKNVYETDNRNCS